MRTLPLHLVVGAIVVLFPMIALLVLVPLVETEREPLRASFCPVWYSLRLPTSRQYPSAIYP